jgi:hypothetical protein
MNTLEKFINQEPLDKTQFSINESRLIDVVDQSVVALTYVSEDDRVVILDSSHKRYNELIAQFSELPCSVFSLADRNFTKIKSLLGLNEAIYKSGNHKFISDNFGTEIAHGLLVLQKNSLPIPNRFIGHLDLLDVVDGKELLYLVFSDVLLPKKFRYAVVNAQNPPAHLKGSYITVDAMFVFEEQVDATQCKLFESDDGLQILCIDLHQNEKNPSKKAKPSSRAQKKTLKTMNMS